MEIFNRIKEGVYSFVVDYYVRPDIIIINPALYELLIIELCNKEESQFKLHIKMLQTPEGELKILITEDVEDFILAYTGRIKNELEDGRRN